jgi:hypothetical protein
MESPRGWRSCTGCGRAKAEREQGQSSGRLDRIHPEIAKTAQAFPIAVPHRARTGLSTRAETIAVFSKEFVYESAAADDGSSSEITNSAAQQFKTAQSPSFSPDFLDLLAANAFADRSALNIFAPLPAFE